MPKFRFSKLVRDKIVETQIASGAKPKYHTLSHDEHITALIAKIVEESQEIGSASPDNTAGEIADVQQALDDLIDLLGVSPQDVARAQREKAAKAGAFKKGIYIDHVAIDEGDPWLDYYRKNADRYPEIT